MILKQRFGNGNERNTYLGNSYTLIERQYNPTGFEDCYIDFYGEKTNVVEGTKDQISAFVVYSEGFEKKIEQVFSDHYNAIMADNGTIYHVITCMPF